MSQLIRSYALGACCTLLVATNVGAAKLERWVGAWGFPATSAPTGARLTAATQPASLRNVTVRQLVRITAPAEQVRLRFSNEFGAAPLQLGAVHVALAGEDGAIAVASDQVVTFSGRPSAAIPAHAVLLSDPIAWSLPAFATLAVSTFLPEETVTPAHRIAEYVSSSGDFTNAERLPGSELVRSGALVSRVDVVSNAVGRTVVALGDSITEGVGSTSNAFRSWPDRLADRLQERPATRDWSIVNAGIGSNRLLHDNPGQGMLARFDRDVLSVPNVAMVLLLAGINDIGYSHTTPNEAVTADDITAAYRQIIARAHAHGIAVIAATLPPFEDSHYYDAHGETLRQSVNEWIRTAGAFDGIVDFDAALRDPAHPTQVKADLHRGDHLHPNDAGYAAMADAIDLKLFTQARKYGFK